MKKLFILLLLIIGFSEVLTINKKQPMRTPPAKAIISKVILPVGIQLNPNTFRYYSLPATPNINQNEYHNLVWQCKDILNLYVQRHASLLAQYPGAMRSSSYDPNNIAGKAAVEQYLKRLAAPTSIRLLEDLKKKNFII